MKIEIGSLNLEKVNIFYEQLNDIKEKSNQNFIWKNILLQKVKSKIDFAVENKLTL